MSKFGHTPGNVKRGAHQQDTAWAQAHNPGSNTLATTTKAAPGEKKRLVITGYRAKLTSGATAPTAAVATVTLSDGTTTYDSETLGAVATAGVSDGYVVEDCWIPLPENTAAVFAFGGAGGTNTYESVNLRGIVEDLQ